MVTHNKYVTREADGKKRDRRYERERDTDTVSGERQREIGKKAQKEKPEKAGEENLINWKQLTNVMNRKF